MGTQLRLVYSPHYNINFFGLERLHPFDSRKYGRAWRVLRRRFGRGLNRLATPPRSPITLEELLHVHHRGYLRELRDPAYLARALEMPPLKRAPAWLSDWRVLRPMRWCTAGTLLAAGEAMQFGVAVNLGGGYHHASAGRGEGFCIYADVALAVDALRRSGQLTAQDRILYIDCDAHQGNGVCHCFFDDSRIFIFDMYNQSIYPAADAKAKRRIDCPVPLPDQCTESRYLADLESRLPQFIDAVSRAGRFALAIYNAGTDIYEDDPLGRMRVSVEGVLRRDEFVLTQLMDRKIPALMLTSGGYTPESYRLIANTIGWLINQTSSGGPNR